MPFLSPGSRWLPGELAWYAAGAYYARLNEDAGFAASLRLLFAVLSSLPDDAARLLDVRAFCERWRLPNRAEADVMFSFRHRQRLKDRLLPGPLSAALPDSERILTPSLSIEYDPLAESRQEFAGRVDALLSSLRASILSRAADAEGRAEDRGAELLPPQWRDLGNLRELLEETAGWLYLRLLRNASWGEIARSAGEAGHRISRASVRGRVLLLAKVLGIPDV